MDITQEELNNHFINMAKSITDSQQSFLKDNNVLDKRYNEQQPINIFIKETIETTRKLLEGQDNGTTDESTDSEINNNG